MQPDSNYRSCPTHCCPIHGCKYGHSGCPVVSGEFVPEPNERWPNNGCELCEADRESIEYLKQRGLVPEGFEGWNAIEQVVAAWDSYINASNPILAAYYLIAVDEAVGDLATYHPDYNLNTGLIGEPDE